MITNNGDQQAADKLESWTIAENLKVPAPGSRLEIFDEGGAHFAFLEARPTASTRWCGPFLRPSASRMRHPVVDSGSTAGAVCCWRRAVDPARAARWLDTLSAHDGGSLPLAGALDIDEVLRALEPRLRPVLGEEVDLLVSQCWVRRARPLHSWHQDGALHAAFVGLDTLLPVFTCWLALTDCGVDAPSIEWVEPPLTTLLAPQELTDSAVRASHEPTAFVRGVFHAGDALAFGGGSLHRTHVTGHMRLRRTSLELRFVDSRLQTPRLAGETRRPAFR